MKDKGAPLFAAASVASSATALLTIGNEMSSISHTPHLINEPQMATATEVSATELSRWPLTNRIFFRFVFCFIIVSFFPFPVDEIPKLGVLDDKVLSIWIPIAQWTGAHVLHFGPVTHHENDGSGDTIFDYVQNLCALLIAIVATALWSVLDRRRLAYDGLYRWFRVYVRLALAAAAFSYGLEKMFTLQMPHPSIHRLTERIGDLSPMGLLWTFMGASASYQIFAGIVETSAGILLLIPRCVTLGAVVAAGALTNIVMLNFGYDVPVKLYSLTLLLLAVILIAPNAKQLVFLFILNREARLSELSLGFSAAWQRWVWTTVQCCFAGLIIWQAAQDLGPDQTPKPAFFGLYDVISSTANWRQVTFDYYFGTKTIAIDQSYAHRIYCSYELGRSSLTLRTYHIGSDCGSLRYRRVGKRKLFLDGVVEGRTVHAILAPVDPPTFLLETRGFHWVNEWPLNV
jgi:uncharacterized membrane protein YphA (DoxX/SURF4 family)